MKVWITKYALSQGIQEAEAEVDEDGDFWVTEPGRSRFFRRFFRAVVLTPSWLARLFGARETVVELKRMASGGITGQWHTVGTDRLLHKSEDSDRMLLHALDYRPRELPRAKARELVGGGG